MMKEAFVFVLSFLILSPAMSGAFGFIHFKEKIREKSMNAIQKWHEKPAMVAIFFNLILKYFEKLSASHLLDIPDQSQEKHEAYYKIDAYHPVWQSFTPKYAVLTRIELYLGRHLWYDSYDSRASSLLLANTKKDTTPLFEHTIRLYISDHKPGDDFSDIYLNEMLTATVDLSEIPKDGGWVSFNLMYRPYHDEYEIPLPESVDHFLLVPGKTYYILLYPEGDINLLNYVKWYYATGDPYKGGEAGGPDIGSGTDFCFRTYGKPDDGVVNRYAVLVGVERTIQGGQPAWGAAKAATCTRDVLLKDKYWHNAEISVYLNYSATREAIEKGIMSYLKKMDGDDILLVLLDGHGGGHGEGGGLMTGDANSFPPEELDWMMDAWNAKAFVMVSTCYSGWWADIVKGDKRVIVTAVSKDEKASAGDWGAGDPFATLALEALSGHIIRDTADYDPDGDGSIDKTFYRGDKIPSWVDFYPDKNGDGFVSAEEVYLYEKYWETHDEHPQISDGYPSLSNNAEDLDITYIGNN